MLNNNPPDSQASVSLNQSSYVKSYHFILEVLTMKGLPRNERQVFDAILMKTLGWDKTRDRISRSQICKITGLKDWDVSQKLKRLAKKGFIISISQGRGWTSTTIHGINLLKFLELHKKMKTASASAESSVSESPAPPPTPTKQPIQQPTQKEILIQELRRYHSDVVLPDVFSLDNLEYYVWMCETGKIDPATIRNVGAYIKSIVINEKFDNLNDRIVKKAILERAERDRIDTERARAEAFKNSDGFTKLGDEIREFNKKFQ